LSRQAIDGEQASDRQAALCSISAKNILFQREHQFLDFLYQLVTILASGMLTLDFQVPHLSTYTTFRYHPPSLCTRSRTIWATMNRLWIRVLSTVAFLTLICPCPEPFIPALAPGVAVVAEAPAAKAKNKRQIPSFPANGPNFMPCVYDSLATNRIQTQMIQPLAMLVSGLLESCMALTEAWN
jgi:hypothetical protein